MTLPFLTALILIALIHFSKPNTFFGIFGRNTGFITYLCLAILLYSTAVLAPKSEKIIFKSIIVVTSINTAYGLIQLLNFDPIPWNLNFSRLVGTFGQPNFFSAMLGFGSIALLHKYLTSAHVREKLVIFFSIFLILLVCYTSQSIQGIYIFLIGAVILVYVKYVSGEKRFVTTSFLITILALFATIIVGMLQVGPLSTLVYQASISYRGFYWRTGLQMGLDHPFTGIGLDNYAYWFQKYRPSEYVEVLGQKAISDSAHNVFIDIFAAGGLLLLLPYILIIVSTTYLGFRSVKVNGAYSDSALIFAIWITYIAQSFISINHIGIAIWGWVSAGSILGNSFLNKLPSRNSLKSNPELDPSSTLFGIFAFVIGLTLALSPVYKDYRFYEAIKQRNDVKLINSLNIWPGNPHYDVLASSILLANGNYKDALEISRRTVKSNPRNFPSWLQIYENPESSDIEKAKSRSEILKLDPLFKFEAPK